MYSMGGLVDDERKSRQMQCIPLYSLIKAAGNPIVNLLVLDVEGAELAVLKTLPWDKVDIEIMTVETDLVGRTLPGGSQKSIRDYIASKGYTRFDHRDKPSPPTFMTRNDLFIRNDIVKKFNVQGYPVKI